MAAVRTLTLNLTRLSRVGRGGSSRRGDLLRLARLVVEHPEASAELVNTGLGLFGATHFGAMAADAADPVSILTPWREAPQAAVPLSFRERGDTAMRGTATPLTDHTAAQQEVRRRREQQLDAVRRADAELVAGPDLAHRQLSAAAMARLEGLIGRALAAMPVEAADFVLRDGAVSLVLTRTNAGGGTVVGSEEGTLRFARLAVSISKVRGDDSASNGAIAARQTVAEEASS